MAHGLCKDDERITTEKWISKCLLWSTKLVSPLTNKLTNKLWRQNFCDQEKVFAAMLANKIDSNKYKSFVASIFLKVIVVHHRNHYYYHFSNWSIFVVVSMCLSRSTSSSFSHHRWPQKFSATRIKINTILLILGGGMISSHKPNIDYSTQLFTHAMESISCFTQPFLTSPNR